MSPGLSSFPRRAAGRARRRLTGHARPAPEPADEYPLAPPSELMFRVTGHGDPANYLYQGRWSRGDLERALAVVEDDWANHHRVLDFGCGPGRILSCLDDVGHRVELHGADIDADAIAWAGRNIPWATFTQIPTWPPMPFEPATFDLVINHSVFSHLPGDYQDAWLNELRRVTTPGARLCLTVHGEYWFRESLTQWQRAGQDTTELERAFREDGLAFYADDGWEQHFPAYYHTAFHTPWYIFEHWATYFDIRAYIVRGALNMQDMIVLERRDT